MSLAPNSAWNRENTQEMLVVDTNNDKFVVSGSPSITILCRKTVSRLWPITHKDLNILEGTTEKSKVSIHSLLETLRALKGTKENRILPAILKSDLAIKSTGDETLEQN